MVKKFVILGAVAAVALPIGIHIRNVSGEASLASLFPIFGLLAFSLLWLHAMSGVFEEWLRKHFDFDSFVHWSSIVIFASIILHPLLLLILVKFNFGAIFGTSNPAIWLGLIGLILLLTYDIGKVYKKYDFFVKNWRNILIISNLGFILIFFHSITLGSDLQAGFLRWLWLFYGITAIVAIIYTYGVKRAR